MKLNERLFTPICVLCALSSVVSPARAEVRLNGLFSDHMVLQREAPVPVWGWSEAGEKVTVSFAGQSKSTTADTTGKWMVSLDPLPASAEPRELLVKSGDGAKLAIKDVLVGEVWLAGGQSNMRAPLSSAHNAAEVLPNARDDQLRYFTVTLKTAAAPLTDVTGAWKPTKPETARDFYAVAYFFARDLRAKLGVPVGVVGVAWGGTPIQTWISLDGFKAQPPIEKQLKEWDKAVAQNAKVRADPKLVTDYLVELKRWQTEVETPFKAASKSWAEAKAAGKDAGEKPKLSSPEPTNPDPMGMPSPSRRPTTPTVGFNGLIAPTAPFAVRGVIWYQGEADGSRGIEYRTLFPRLIQDWRELWAAELPFLFVQIPGGGADKDPVATSGMPWTREAQFMALRLPRTSMASIIDLGDPNDAHPAGKAEVGRRLALLARRDVYGETLVASGPLYKGFAIEGDRIRIRFTDTGTGLIAGQAPWRAPGVEPFPTDRLIGFFIAGHDRAWTAAEAVIDGDTLMVSSKTVSKPVAVRYGWANSPQCNLYNREALPAAPFRTDDWDTPAPSPK